MNINKWIYMTSLFFSNQPAAIEFARKHWVDNGEPAWVVKSNTILGAAFEVHLTPPPLSKGQQIIFRAGD